MLKRSTAIQLFLFFLLLGAALLSGGVVSDAIAEKTKKGAITSSKCPYSCKSKGIKKKHCRDWKEGDRCYVEDLRKKKKK